MTALVVTILVVLLGSGVCSGSEIALLSVPPVRARQLAETGGSRAQALLAIKEHIARPVAAIVVLNNIFNIVGSILVGATATAAFGSGSVGVVSAVLTLLIIMFGEIAPKTLGERYAEPVALAVAVPARWLTTIMTPLVVLIEVLMRPLTRGERVPTTNEGEIQLMARIGRTEGVIEDHEVELIQRVFQLNDLKAQDLMTPRTMITWLDASRRVAEVREQILTSEHSRIVVADGDLDGIQGVALRHELASALADGRDVTVGDCARPVRAVPWVVSADTLLQQFRRDREHLVFVVDEYGGTAGVVTLEDVIEVLTGPIYDETDTRADLRAFARARARHRAQSGFTRPSRRGTAPAAEDG